MDIIFDPVKNERNIKLRGLSFERVSDFDFETAVFTIDTRRDYGEIRYRVQGFLGKRLHSLIMTETPHGIRVISFRKANRREIKAYEQATRPCID